MPITNGSIQSLQDALINIVNAVIKKDKMKKIELMLLHPDMAGDQLSNNLFSWSIVNDKSENVATVYGTSIKNAKENATELANYHGRYIYLAAKAEAEQANDDFGKCIHKFVFRETKRWYVRNRNWSTYHAKDIYFCEKCLEEKITNERDHEQNYSIISDVLPDWAVGMDRSYCANNQY